MASTDPTPWYRRVYRWGQTNLTEIDPSRYDAAWWREHWRLTRVQGVIVNAGGIVAYYPSKYPLQYRAFTLADRDFYGEIVAAAREHGLAVLARMDSNRANTAFYIEHPDWFTVDAEGRPHRAEDRYIACVNSPYYDEFLPDVLREIIERSHPDGITDNSWTAASTAPPSRSSAGTRNTSSSWSIVVRWPAWALSGLSRTSISTAARPPTSASCCRGSARARRSSGPASRRSPSTPTTLTAMQATWTRCCCPISVRCQMTSAPLFAASWSAAAA